MPIIVDKRVVKSVGKMMSDGEDEPSVVRSAITEDGISWMLVAFITKNIVMAYSVFGCFSSSLMDFIPIGVVAPLIPKMFAEMFNDIKSFAFSGSFPKRKLLTGFNALENLFASPVRSSNSNTPIQTAYITTIFIVKSSAFCPPFNIEDNIASGLVKNSKTEQISITSPKIMFI